jgi:hypothetical protein
MAKFERDNGKGQSPLNPVVGGRNPPKQFTIHFGANGMMDYTKYYKQDKEVAKIKRESYLARHKANENWNDPTTAGSLSRWILWNLPTLDASVKDFKKKFNI